MQSLKKVDELSTSPSPNISPKLSLDEIRKNIIDEMEKGKESLQMIRSISLQRSRLKLEDGHQEDQDFHKALDHHSMVALNAYVTSISMLKSFSFDRQSKRKIEQLDEGDCHDGDCKSEGSSMDSPMDITSGRGRYKRSRTGEARMVEVTQLSDDGFAWRKYGQKTILNAAHPRNYYRCTHKHDQKCQATKQVQQISENPTKYQIIYHGNHTCSNILKANPIIIDPTEEHSSAIFLNFDQSNNQLNPALFPTAAYPVVKQEQTSIKQETPSISYDSCSNSAQISLCSPSLNNISSALAVTTTIGLSSSPVSEQSDIISTAENYSTANSTRDDVEEDYSHMWADLELFEDLYAC